jgi:hypothetical protein
MPIAFSPTVTADRLQALTRALDQSPSAPGQMRVYGGAQPPAGDAPTGPILVTLLFQKPSAGPVVGNTLTLAMPTPGMVINSGIATWARFTDGAGAFVADIDVGIVGSTAALQLSGASTQIYAGGQLDAGSFTLVD